MSDAEVETSRRLYRFSRNKTPESINVTPFVEQILRKIDRYDLIKAEHVAAALGASRQYTGKVLNKMYRAHLVDREKLGTFGVAYYLGKRGAQVIGGGTPRRPRHIGHTVMNAEVMAVCERDCLNRSDVEMIFPEEIIDRYMLRQMPADGKPFKWPAYFHYKGKSIHHDIEPDFSFGLRRSLLAEKRSSTLCFLETDTGSEPNEPTENFYRASPLKKMLQYAETWENWRRGDRLFNFPGFRVLFATKNRQRAENIVEAARQRLGVSRAGLVLACDVETLHEAGFFAPVWLAANRKCVSLLD